MHPALTLQFERAVNEYAQWQAVPAEDRSDAPAWWWDTALAAVDETATMPVEWCVTLGVADGSTYAKGAEVFKNALLGQTYLPQSENFPRKFKAIELATGRGHVNAPSPARSPRKPTFFEFGTGFLPSETGAPKRA